jgi:hypothetical protein
MKRNKSASLRGAADIPAKMQITDVRALVREALDSLPRPYSEHVIDEVFFAIELDARWLRDYETLRASLGKSVVNNWGGYWVADMLGKVGKQKIPSKKSKLIGTYRVLDTTDKTVMRKRKENEALQLMADYYHAHKAELPPEIRKHREFIVELLIEGAAPEAAFQVVLENGA